MEKVEFMPMVDHCFYYLVKVVSPFLNRVDDSKKRLTTARSAMLENELRERMKILSNINIKLKHLRKQSCIFIMNYIDCHCRSFHREFYENYSWKEFICEKHERETSCSSVDGYFKMRILPDVKSYANHWRFSQDMRYRKTM
eukprot:scaffold62112_cov23-Cyclotella_meneghiniana.AAC.2